MDSLLKRPAPTGEYHRVELLEPKSEPNQIRKKEWVLYFTRHQEKLFLEPG